MENQTQQKTVMYPLDENTTWLINTLTKAIETGDFCFKDSKEIKGSELFLMDVLRAFSIVRAGGISLDDTQADRIAQIDCIIREHGSCSLEKEVSVEA